MANKFLGKDTRKLIVNQLPYEVYRSVVHSLHGDSKALFIGMLCTWIAIAGVWFKSGNDVFLWSLAVLVMVGLARFYALSSYLKKSHNKFTRAQLRKVETNYAIWATFFVGLLGSICLVSMAVTQDETIHLVLFCMTLAYILGIAGRNFGSSKVVSAQVVAVSVPLMIGLVIFGTIYHKMLAALLLPFLLALQMIAHRLRQMLFDAVFTAMENKTIANRFEIAMKNASHGMAMLDRNGVFLVANQRFNQLFGVETNAKLLGTKLKNAKNLEMAGRAAMRGHVSLTDRLLECMQKAEKQRFTYSRLDGLTLEANFNPMTEGAGVLVLEDISERVNSENEIRQLANYDPLTHLSNRRYFTDQIEEQVKNNPDFSSYSTYFLDLDKFKDINDSLGHSVGDKLLCVVSLRMKSCLPKGGMICRFGGDEFIIVLPNVTEQEECKAFAQQIIEEVTKPILIDGNLIIVQTSVGIALCPADESEFEQLLKMADVSLYQAKSNGRGTYCFYNDELGGMIKERRQMEVDIRRAIENQEFSVHYQPLIDIKHNVIAGCEALVRWKHPTKGNIPPSIFIPIAEEIGLISKIGKFVLEQATRECKSWPNHMRVAVNVSSLQFKQSDVCDVVTKALIKSGLEPNRLEIEVTESSVIEDLDETSRVLRSLAQGGVRISLDDFGTGFSSLSYLHQLPLDKVKIDRSFVETIRNDQRSLILLSGVTKMAANLGLMIIVEGVEETEQLELLKKEVHMDQVQGYLFGKPMPSNEINNFIKHSDFDSNVDLHVKESA